MIFSFLNIWDNNGVYFVIRYQENIKPKTLKELELPKERHEHLLKDEFIVATRIKTKDKYSDRVHTLALWDNKNQQTMGLLLTKCLRHQTHYR